MIKEPHSCPYLDSFLPPCYSLVYLAEFANGNYTGGYRPVLLPNHKMHELFRHSMAHGAACSQASLGPHSLGLPHPNQVYVLSTLPLPFASKPRRNRRKQRSRSASTHAHHSSQQTQTSDPSVEARPGLGIRQLSLRSLQNFQKSLKIRAVWKNAYSKVKLLIRKEKFLACRAILDRALLHITFMHESRWLEVLDSRHRYGGDLEKQWKIWKSTKTSQAFFEWLEKQPVTISEVQYLSPTARCFYKLRVENGVCKTQKEGILHTEDVDAPHIFVLSTARICYVGRYERGYFHHSSLVAGEAVLAAGEMIFSKKGKLKQITDKSGHYRTEAAATRAIVLYLQNQSIDMEHIVVSMDCAREPFTTMRHAPGKEFLPPPPPPLSLPPTSFSPN